MNTEAVLAIIKTLANVQTVTQVVPFEIGKAYLIHSATVVNVGRVVSITGGFIVLEDAAKIADTSRYSDEVKPYPDGCFIAISGIIDAYPWRYPLPLARE